MSATPARDALDRLIHNAVWRSDEECDDQMTGLTAYEVQTDLIANPDLVLAALIESGWTPTDDQLRAMGRCVYGRSINECDCCFPKEQADG